jgi:hypothetical protein
MTEHIMKFQCFIVSCNVAFYLAPHQLCWVQVAVIWQQSCIHLTCNIGLPCLCFTINGPVIASAMKTTLLTSLSVL